MKDNATPDKTTESHKNREKEGEAEASTDLGFQRFKKILAGPDFGSDDTKSENPDIREKTAPKTGEEADVHERPEFHFKEGLMNMRVAKFMVAEKERIIKYTAGIIGGIFLLSGVILLFTAATRVVDNVIFGERAMFSSFLILIGIIILITVFGRRYWHDTVLKKLNIEMEISEGKSESGIKDQETQKSNIEDENKK
ncbi:MAG: hypothetical protein LUQ70_03840 [Methanobacteriaceae archaeon]|nr:hypothetical protein [Methanobacteriaceae archaeon]